MLTYERLREAEADKGRMLVCTNKVMNKIINIVLLVTLILPLGCRRNSIESSPPADTPQAAMVYSETELEKIITLGMSLMDVTNKFGLPGSAIELSENTVLLAYMFPFEVKKPEDGPYLTGFSIDIKDGHVSGWSPITGMTGKTVQGGGQISFGEQTLQLFLVTDNMASIVNTVESEGSADASGLKFPPAITFKAKVSTGNSGSERTDEQTVILFLNERDVSKLKDLSQNNFGKRLLIVCRDRVIAAPTITAPLASRQLQFTVKAHAF